MDVKLRGSAGDLRLTTQYTVLTEQHNPSSNDEQQEEDCACKRRLSSILGPPPPRKDAYLFRQDEPWSIQSSLDEYLAINVAITSHPETHPVYWKPLADFVPFWKYVLFRFLFNFSPDTCVGPQPNQTTVKRVKSVFWLLIADGGMIHVALLTNSSVKKLLVS